MKTISIEIVLNAFQQVLAHRPEPAPSNLDGQTRVVDLDLESLDLAEILILIEQEVGYELDPYSVNPIDVVLDFTRFKKRQ